jgi:hypothetical protein
MYNIHRRYILRQQNEGTRLHNHVGSTSRLFWRTYGRLTLHTSIVWRDILVCCNPRCSGYVFPLSNTVDKVLVNEILYFTDRRDIDCHHWHRSQIVCNCQCIDRNFLHIVWRTLQRCIHRCYPIDLYIYRPCKFLNSLLNFGHQP